MSSTWAGAVPSTVSMPTLAVSRMYVHRQPGDRRLQRHGRHERLGASRRWHRRGPEGQRHGGRDGHGLHLRPQPGPGRQRQHGRQRRPGRRRGSRRRDRRGPTSPALPSTASGLILTDNQAIGGTGNTAGPLAGDGIGGGLAVGGGNTATISDSIIAEQSGHRRPGSRRRQRRGWAGWRPREHPGGHLDRQRLHGHRQ